jgi:hypothetical protein
VIRREFHRADTLVIRGSAKGTLTVSGRLLDRRGQPLTDLPVATAADAPEIRLALGSLGPGDYVVELTTQSGDAAAQQFVAFRLLR